MEQILINLKNPEWWFTGLFFLLIGIVLTKAFSSWLPWAWRVATERVPALNRGIARKLKLRLLKKVRKNRSKDLYIIWVIGRYWASSLIFAIYVGFVLFYFITTIDFNNEGGVSKGLKIAVVPLYAYIVAIVFEKKYLFMLLRQNHKLKQRITRQARVTA